MLVVALAIYAAAIAFGLWAAIWVKRRLSFNVPGDGAAARVGEVSFRAFLVMIVFLAATTPFWLVLLAVGALFG